MNVTILTAEELTQIISQAATLSADLAAQKAVNLLKANEPQDLSRSAAADLLGVSKSTIDKARADKILPVLYRVGRRPYYAKADVLKLRQ